MLSLYLEEQTEADPLIVSDISSLLRVHCLVNAGMSNINTFKFILTRPFFCQICYLSSSRKRWVWCRWSVSSSRCPSRPGGSPPRCSLSGLRCRSWRSPGRSPSTGSRRWPAHGAMGKGGEVSCVYLVMKPEHIVIDTNVIKFDVPL